MPVEVERGDVLARREQIEAPLDPVRYTTLRRLVESDNHRLVVSFGGGAIPGLCGNLALARILEELELRPRVEEIWGTSAGAVCGGGWATGTPALRILELVKSLDGAMRGELARFAGRLVSALLLRRPLPAGVVRGDAFRETIDAGLAVKTFEECLIPFRCVVVTGDGLARRRVLRKGPLLPAIFASMTIPGIVEPRSLPGDDTSYADGGLAEKTPLLSPISHHVTRSDERKLLLVCTHFAGEPTEPGGFLTRLVKCIDALENLTWDYQLKEARQRDDIALMVLNPQLRGTSLFGFHDADRYYLASREAFADVLQNAKVAQTLGAW